MTTDQLQRELSYRVAMNIARKLLAESIIDNTEYEQIQQIIAERFSPIWSR